MKTVPAYVCDILMTEGVYCNSTADLEQEVGKILREVWQSATKAQMDKDNNEYTQTVEGGRFTELQPFPRPDMSIPDKEIQICRELAAIAVKHNLTQMVVHLRPAWDSEWRDEIMLHWEWGRHGEGGGQMRIESTTRVHAKVNVSESEPTP